jgi:hypothetical protein
MLNEHYLYVLFTLEVLQISPLVACALTDHHALHTPIICVICVMSPIRVDRICTECDVVHQKFENV